MIKRVNHVPHSGTAVNYPSLTSNTQFTHPIQAGLWVWPTMPVSGMNSQAAIIGVFFASLRFSLDTVKMALDRPNVFSSLVMPGFLRSSSRVKPIKLATPSSSAILLNSTYIEVWLNGHVLVDGNSSGLIEHEYVRTGSSHHSWISSCEALQSHPYSYRRHSKIEIPRVIQQHQTRRASHCRPCQSGGGWVQRLGHSTLYTSLPSLVNFGLRISYRIERKQKQAWGNHTGFILRLKPKTSPVPSQPSSLSRYQVEYNILWDTRCSARNIPLLSQARQWRA